jgi:hypothetical protein
MPMKFVLLKQGFTSELSLKQLTKFINKKFKHQVYQNLIGHEIW